MRKRNPFVVLLLTLITFGIYGLVWEVKTKNDMNKLGADIPTAWLLIVPLVNLWWLWKYSEGVEKATSGQTSGVLAFVLLFLLGVIGMVILQFEFNKVGDQPMVAAAAPSFGQPAPGFGAPTGVAPNQFDTPATGATSAAPVATQPGTWQQPAAPQTFSPGQPQPPTPIDPSQPQPPVAQ